MHTKVQMNDGGAVQQAKYNINKLNGRSFTEIRHLERILIGDMTFLSD